jgi:hypothetical protein
MTEGGRWRTVGIVLAIGAIYDFAFAVAILGFTRSAASVLGLRIPGDPVYLYLNGVFLLLLAALYGAAARSPERYLAVAPISAGGRALGCLLFVWAWHDGRPTTFLGLGLVDLLLGAVTIVVWQRAVRVSD